MWAEIGYAILAIWVWEYIGIRVRKQLGWQFISPTTILGLVTDLLKYCFDRLGRFVAHLSSVLVYLHLEDFFKAGWALVVSVWDLLTSGYEFVRGYFTVSFTFKKSYLIYLGSFLLWAAAILGACHWFELDLTDTFNRYWVGMSLFVGAFATFIGEAWYNKVETETEFNKVKTAIVTEFNAAAIEFSTKTK